MGTIKGLALLSRFDYLEGNYGPEKYEEFINKISTPEENYARQPVVGANNYPESTLSKIDELLIKEYFKDKEKEFFRLGEWNAENLLPKYFMNYMDENLPFAFVDQYSRLRDYFLGSGTMELTKLSENVIFIQIDYGQNIPRSVCLSEQGFLAEGMHLCGARKVEIKEESCAALSDSFVCKYQIIVK